MLDLDICSSFTRNHRRKHQPKLPDCPDLLTADALPGRRIHAQVGTIVRSEQSALFRCRNNAEYERMSVTPSSLQLGCRTSYYAQLLRPPCARFGVLGSWRYAGLPVVIPWPDKVQAVEATHAQLSMIDQAQLAPKRCCRAVFLGDLLSRFR